MNFWKNETKIQVSKFVFDCEWLSSSTEAEKSCYRTLRWQIMSNSWIRLCQLTKNTPCHHGESQSLAASLELPPSTYHSWIDFFTNFHDFDFSKNTTTIEQMECKRGILERELTKPMRAFKWRWKWLVSSKPTSICCWSWCFCSWSRLIHARKVWDFLEFTKWVFGEFSSIKGQSFGCVVTNIRR